MQDSPQLSQWSVPVPISRDLQTGSPQFSYILQQIVTEIQKDLGFDRVRLYMKAGTAMVGKAHVGMQIPFEGVTLELDKSQYLKTLSAKSEVTIEKRQMGQTYFYDNALDRQDVSEWATLPLAFNEEIVGFLVGDNKYTHRPLNQADVTRLKTFAPLIAIALYATRLFAGETGRAAQIENERARLEQVLNASPSGVVANNEKGIIVFASRAALELLGYSLEEILGQHVTMLYAKPADALEIGAMLKSHDPFMIDRQAATLLNKSGESIAVQLTVASIVGITDFPLKVGFFEDLRPLHEAQERIRTAQRTTEALVQSLSAFTTAEQAWQHVVISAVKIVDGDGARILFIEEPNRTLYPIIGIGNDTLKLANPLQADSITHQIGRSGQRHIINDISQHPELNEHSFIHRGIKAAIGLPITNYSTNKPYGVLWIYYSEPHHFERWEIETLESLLQRSSDRIYAIEEYERTFEYLGALDQLVQAAKEQTSEEQLLQLIAQQALQLTFVAGQKAHNSHVIVVKDERYLQIGAAYPEVDRTAIQNRLNQVDLRSTDNPIGIAGLAINHRKPIIVPDVRNNPNYITFHPETHSEIAVPIFRGTQVHSIINVEHSSIDAFGERELKLLITLANQASTALQIAPLYQREKKYSTAMAALSSTSHTLNVGNLLEEIAEQVHLLMRNDGNQISYASIWLCNTDLTEAVVHATYPGEYVKYIRAINNGVIDLSGKSPIGVVGRAIKTRDEQVVADVTMNQDYIKSFPDTRSELAVPIIIRNTVIGVINAEHSQLNAFDEIDVETLKSFARSAADAIVGSQIRQAINRTGQALIQELELQALFPQILQHVLELTKVSGRPAKLCYLGLLRENRLVFVYFLPEKQFTHLQSIYPELDLSGDRIGINGFVAQTGKPVLASDVRDKQWQGIYIPYDPDIRCCLGVPILVDGKVAGVITVEHTDVGAFELFHQEVLEMFATHAAIAIKIARKYDETRLLRQVAEQLTQSNSRSDILQTILQGALELTQAEVATIKFWDAVTKSYIEAFSLVDVNSLVRPYSTSARESGGYTRHVIDSQKPKIINDISQDKGVNSHVRAQGWLSMILVPVTLKNKNAVISLYSRHKGYFSHEHEDILMALASQTAVALDKIETIEDLELLGPHNFATWWNMIKERMGHRISGYVFRSLQELDTLRIKLEGLPFDQAIQEQIQNIDTEIREIEHLLPLEYSTTLRTVQLNGLLRNFFLEMSQRRHYRHLNIHLNLQEDLDQMAGVQINDLLREVLNILVENSARAVQHSNVTDKRLIITSRLQEHTVEIHIRDFGPGIPAHVLPQLFRKPITQSVGKGIGLWQARGFLEALDGTIEHITPQDNGCEMVLSLPVVPAYHN